MQELTATIKNEWAEYCYCSYYDDAPATIRGFIWMWLSMWGAATRCFFTGHNLADLDPGNPENGPMPDVQCEHCGRCF